MRTWVAIALVAAAIGSGWVIRRVEAEQPILPVTPTAVTPSADGLQISIAQFKFGPNTLSIQTGTTVTWTNRDQESHTVTSTAGAFASPALDPGEMFSYRFTAPGTYTYFCALHPHMTARITVN